MKKYFFEILILTMIIIGFIIGLTAVIDKAEKNGYEKGYKAACADFYQGHLKYDLITNPDGTKEWKRVK